MLKIELRTPRNRILNGWRVLAKDPVKTLGSLREHWGIALLLSVVPPSEPHTSISTPQALHANREPGSPNPRSCSLSRKASP